jgi:broad specificity phosphatase PhoE
MHIILIRHCKTLFNITGRIMGWSDSPRSENWRDDLVYIEDELRRRKKIPDLVYTSALERSRHTGDFLAGRFGRPVLHSQALNEVDYGSLAEKSKKWVVANYPQHKRDPEFRYPGGESFAEMSDRAVEFTTELAGEYGGQTVLCVAHAGVIRALVSHFLALDFAQQLRRAVPHRYIGALSFRDSMCHTYDEWGEPSGFAREGVLRLPWSARGTGDCSEALSP